MVGGQPVTQGEAEEGEPPCKTARSGYIVMVIDGETFRVPEEDVPKVYDEEDDGQVPPIEQVHEGMQREFQLMTDLEVSEKNHRTDVSSGKKIWTTRWCHRRKGAGVRSRFVVKQFRDTDWETAFSGVPGLVVVRVLLCISTILESSAVPVTSVAFISTPLHDAEFIEPPIEDDSDSRYVWKLHPSRKEGSAPTPKRRECTTDRQSAPPIFFSHHRFPPTPNFHRKELQIKLFVHLFVGVSCQAE